MPAPEPSDQVTVGPHSHRATDAERASKSRRFMVEQQLFARGIRDPRVLAAMAGVPREQFVPRRLADAAFEDRALPIDEGQTISQPYMVALMTERLELAPSHRVLEIGTGTGYQTAILARLCGHVFTIERIATLARAAAERLAALAVTNVSARVGDGSLGWPDHAPFDRIIVTAGAPRVPAALRAQLAPGGRLVAPVGDELDQTLLIVRRGRDEFTVERSVMCRFVRLIGAEAWAE